ncbi:unnamed protein product [Acanthoscelides obtectus]|uniref:Uncharacterized protein n=1 Tax=Acanthoscelides obtectus TaxID=200917 RepID=A0A9P0KLU2_ACAOB|nr:unnamed protein product [Acanthoscelides obtectus]CAK1680345.1 hypothetical protein AOBTE_LOCUS32588 [Acanthoscelides obtectus]
MIHIIDEYHEEIRQSGKFPLFSNSLELRFQK